MLFTAIILILYSCANRENLNQKHKHDTIVNTATSPFIGEIGRGVDKFIQYVEGMDLGIPLTKEAFTLYFYNKDGKT